MEKEIEIVIEEDADVEVAIEPNAASQPLLNTSNEVAESIDDSGESAKNAMRAQNFGDVQQKMNIHHFEQLMKMFHEHRNVDGSFREVFVSLFEGNVSVEQMNMLFMKIDANSDGTVTWDEFSTYMMSVSIDSDHLEDVLDEKSKKLAMAPHKDLIVTIEYVAKERKYLTVSREGDICMWSLSLRLQRSISTRSFNPRQCWVHDAKFMPEHGKLMVVSDDRQLCIYDLFAIKPRLIAVLTQLEHNPLSDYDEDTDLILFGDDGGYVNVMYLKRRFFLDNASEMSTSEHLTPLKLMKKDALEKHNISMYRRQMHSDWVLKVQYFPEMNAFVSCSNEPGRTLVVGDLERKTFRAVSVPKGVKCFEFSRRPSFLVTGGRDKIVRLWNPYVLNKATASLYGHNAGIIKIVINHDDGHIITLSDDKVIKIWNARNLSCLQTILDNGGSRPEDLISAICFDPVNRQIVTGSSKLEIHPLASSQKQVVETSHEAPLVGAMFNSSFHQVVSACQMGSVILWDPSCGEKIFNYHRAHGTTEITAICFDRSGRRLMTGSRDRTIKMWNFNNGRVLRQFIKPSAQETTDILYVEMGANRYIIAVGWDKKILVYPDDPTRFDVHPARVLNATGSGAHSGHQDDLSAVAFCPPNILATASVDGVIVIWNLESGYIKCTMREPFLDLRSKEEKPVENILFVYNPDRASRPGTIPLLTCHADGCLRGWDYQAGEMIDEFNCQVEDDEGLTTMAANDDCSTLILGGSKGHIRLIDLKALLAHVEDSGSGLVVTALWRAHVASVCSVSYVKQYDMILSSSKDMCVRLWTKAGVHVGTFGERTWDIYNPSTYSLLPPELLHDQELETKRKEMATAQEAAIKKNVIESWKGVVGGSMRQANMRDTAVRKIKIKSMQAAALKRWRDVLDIRKSADDWSLTSDLVTVKNSKQFFSFDIAERPKTVKTPLSVKHDSVYHALEVHAIDDVNSNSFNHPLRSTVKPRRA